MSTEPAAAQLKELAPLHRVTPYEVSTVDLSYFHHDIVNRRHAERSANDPELSADLYRYYRFREAIPHTGRNLTMVFQPWLVPDGAELATVFLREITRSIGSRLGADLENALQSYRIAIEEIAPIAGAAADSLTPGAGTLLRALARATWGTPSTPATMEELRSEVAKKLIALRGRRVVVVVDDLDRLTPKEAVQMIGLIKGLGGLPNLVYVLSYDESNLSKLINSELRLDGIQFLEKIIQYKRHLPLLSPQATSELFYSCLDGASPPIHGEMLERLQELWGSEIRKHLTTPRDALRIGNSFRVGWDSVGEFIDASDHLALQFLSIKDAQLYEWIKQNVRKLCGQEFRLTINPNPDLFFEGINIDQYPWRTNLLSWLFPAVAEILGKEIRSGRRFDRRLSEYDYRHAYFDLAKPAGVASVVAMSQLMADVDYENFLNELFNISKEAADPVSARSNILEDLRQHFGDGRPIPIGLALAVIKNAKWLIEEEPTAIQTGFDESNLQRILSILYRGLSAIAPQKRGQFMLEMITKADDLSIVTSTFRTAFGSERQMDFSGDESQIISALTGAIEARLSPSWLFNQAIPDVLLAQLNDAGLEEKVFSVTSDAMDGEHFASVVELAVSGVRSTAPPYYWEYVRNQASDILDLDKLQMCAKMELSSGSPEGTAAAERFIKALATPETGPR